VPPRSSQTDTFVIGWATSARRSMSAHESPVMLSRAIVDVVVDAAGPLCPDTLDI
jgi:hypothetical protein